MQEDLSSVVVRPGDTLIVLIDKKDVTDDEAKRYREKAATRLPGVNIVLLGGTRGVGALVYRPGEQQAVA